MSSVSRQKVLVIQHVSRERPGFIRCVLEEKGVDFDCVDLQCGDPMPELVEYSAMVVLGGPESANDDCSKMSTVKQAVRRWLELDKPYLGICLGMQVLGKVLGCDIQKSPLKEIGFRDHSGEYFSVGLTEQGRIDPIFEGSPSQFTVFQWHEEMVCPHESVIELARGKHCRVQAIKHGKHAYGFQFHCEVTPQMMHQWVSEHGDALGQSRVYEIQNDFAQLENDYVPHGKTLFHNFLSIAQVI